MLAMLKPALQNLTHLLLTVNKDSYVEEIAWYSRDQLFGRNATN